jgi:hypothetical protein
METGRRIQGSVRAPEVPARKDPLSPLLMYVDGGVVLLRNFSFVWEVGGSTYRINEI